MKRVIKRGLLRFGGYRLAKKIQLGLEMRELRKRVDGFQKTGVVPLPDMVMFEPTQRCNLRCKMCFQDRQVLENCPELSSDQISSFFHNNPFLKKITFIGGEIFVRRDMVDIIQQLDDSRDIVLCTNATLLSRSAIEALKKCRRIFTICVSLEGPQNVNDSIRGVPGSFERTVKVIAELAGFFPITVNAVIQNDNIHVLRGLVSICRNLGVKKLKLELERLFCRDAIGQALVDLRLEKPDVPLCSDGRERRYSAGKLKSVLDECRRHGEKEGVLVSIDPPYLMENLESCYAGSARSMKDFICQSFRTATIAPNGDVIHCLTIRKPFGNIIEEPLEKIWNSEAANLFRRRLLEKNMSVLCENCPFMHPK